MAKTRTAGDLMTPNSTFVTPEASLTETAQLMISEDTGIIPVVEDRNTLQLAGVVTDRDIVVRAVARELDVATTTVREVMSPDVSTLTADASIDDCVRLMAKEQVRRVPIVDGGKLVGIVSQADLARASAEEPQLEDELAELVEEVSEPAHP